MLTPRPFPQFRIKCIICPYTSGSVNLMSTFVNAWQRTEIWFSEKRTSADMPKRLHKGVWRNVAARMIPTTAMKATFTLPMSASAPKAAVHPPPPLANDVA